MPSTQDIRRKIKSVQSTKKITQAMQMVAASKMQKAIDNNQKSRAYSDLAWEIIRDLASRTNIGYHPLLAKRSVKRIGVILVTSNRGLCGPFNNQVIKKFIDYMTEAEKHGKRPDLIIDMDLVSVGNKGRNYIHRFHKDKLVADFTGADSAVEFKDIGPIAKIVIDDYISQKYDKIVIIYNHFISKMTQEATVRQILPIPRFAEQKETRNPNIEIQNDVQNSNDQNENVTSYKLQVTRSEYKFEPSIKFVLDTMLPQIIKTQIFQILLESNASEHSARMIAMKNATDNASDLIDDLTLTYNSIRQAAITSEIAEISAGAEALRVG